MSSNALKSSIARLGSRLEEHKKGAIPMDVALDSLVPYARQRRRTFDEAELADLADSIKDLGVMQPLLVRPIASNRFEIIAGERRQRAARIAGLVAVPVLSRQMDDETAYRMHLAENIQRENLTTLELALSVQEDLKAAQGNLAVVAAKYNKGKSWVSKLSAIAQGGSTMTALIDEGVTADRAVLATVASLERKEPERAQALSQQLKAAPVKANKRELAERFMKNEREVAKPRKQVAPPKKASKTKVAAATEPSWHGKAGVERDLGQALIVVELSPVSTYVEEFRDMSKRFGKARLVVSLRHPDESYAIVQFGNSDAHRRAYRADELRLLQVS